ncbi:MAG: MFS transporter [Streptosporangiaceae bacterium]|nr:MFS transporter [Streptosporangiaceae bacterium]
MGLTSSHDTDAEPGRAAIRFRNPAVFWLGILACTVGVLLHLPMYLSARQMGYRMAGMTPDPAMLAGMAAIVAGLAMAAYALIPPGRKDMSERPRISALGDAPITRSHVGLLIVMGVAVTIDVMKPTTLAFIAPGISREYGLRSALNPHGHPPEALLPLAGIAGTVIGSLIWGSLADRIGRRASILLAGLLFTTTAICGAMPGFSWNLLMCFLMGLGAGGMLPITFTLLAETVPTRHRGWLMVLIGGNLTAAYAITSWLSGTLIPHYSWRIMWLIGLPTGLLVILLNRWIPESPRFLLGAGRTGEAKAIMDRYGARIVAVSGVPSQEAASGGYRRLFGPGYAGPTIALILLGLGVGLMTYGFQLWLPSNLEQIGFTEVGSSQILRDSALLGLPLNILTAFAYGFWSSKKTVIALAGLSTIALVGLALAGRQLTGDRLALYGLLAIPLWAMGSIVAVLGAYSSEIYPTHNRARGSGIAAGASKAGGVAIIALVAMSLAPPSLATTALIGAVPLGIAAVAVSIAGVETRQQSLEEIIETVLPQPSVAGTRRTGP